MGHMLTAYLAASVATCGLYSLVRFKEKKMNSTNSNYRPDRKPSSWVIRERGTNRVLCETFSEGLADTARRDERYEVLSIHAYLCELNDNLKKMRSV